MSEEQNKLIIKESRDNGVVILSLNRPEKRNALNDDLFRALRSAVKEIEQDSDVRVAVITGSKIGEKRFFSAGIDLVEVMHALQADVSGKSLLAKAKEWQDTYSMIANSSLPFVCAIEGPCFGAGLELALACDLRVAAKDAQFGLLETKLGIIADLGGTTRLTKLIGPAKAKRLIFTSEIISGVEAKKLGIVEWVPPEGKTTLETSLEIAGNIARNGPLAIQISKNLINKATELDTEQLLALELKEQEKLFRTEDAMEGFLAALEKRTPKFKGK